MQPYLEEAVRASHLPYLLTMSSVIGQLPDGNGAQGGRDSLLLSELSAWQHGYAQQMFYKLRHFSRPWDLSVDYKAAPALCLSRLRSPSFLCREPT